MVLDNAADWAAQELWEFCHVGFKPWLHCAIVKVHPMLKDRGVPVVAATAPLAIFGNVHLPRQ
jgi:hypothetical protein